MSYKLNESVYIPGHGISVLTEIKLTSLIGQTVNLMTFVVQQTGLKIMIPEGSKAMYQLRQPVAQQDAQAALDLLQAEPVRVENKPNYKKWNKMITATIQAGDTLDLAALVSKLEGQRADGPLATNEQRLLDTAKQILKSELELVLGKEVVFQAPRAASMLHAA